MTMILNAPPNETGSIYRPRDRGRNLRLPKGWFTDSGEEEIEEEDWIRRAWSSVGR